MSNPFTRVADKILGPRIDRQELKDMIVVTAALCITIILVNKVFKQ